jgi:hypothetical protein
MFFACRVGQELHIIPLKEKKNPLNRSFGTPQALRVAAQPPPVQGGGKGGVSYLWVWLAGHPLPKGGGCHR